MIPKRVQIVPFGFRFNPFQYGEGRFVKADGLVVSLARHTQESACHGGAGLSVEEGLRSSQFIDEHLVSVFVTEQLA